MYKKSDCPNGPKLQIHFMNLAVDLSISVSFISGSTWIAWIKNPDLIFSRRYRFITLDTGHTNTVIHFEIFLSDTIFKSNSTLVSKDM